MANDPTARERPAEPGPAAARERVPLDALTWERWRRTMRAVVTSEIGGRTRLLFGALLLLLLAINGLNVVNSYVGRDFMTSIERRSMGGFVSMGILYVGVFAASTVVAVIYRFTEERLALLWRNWLTHRLVVRYLDRATYYRLREQDALANPDQRIADDVRTFTTMTLSLTLVLLNTAFTIVAFSGVMWTISPLLFAVAVGYAALGSGLTFAFGRPLIWLNYDQTDREASLRAELVHLRDHAESVAFLHREGRIRGRIEGRVDRVVENMKRIVAVNRNLGFFTTGYNYLIQVIPILIVAPLFIRGRVEFGVISQSSMAFAHLIGAFSLVVTQFQQISSYAVVLARLGALSDAIERVEDTGGSQIAIAEEGGEIVYAGLTLRSPVSGDVLVRALDVQFPAHTRTLVTGASEGRIALFRATAGLWDSGEGRIIRPPPGDLLFLTERPYLPPGSLRHALLRTGSEDQRDDARIAEALHALDLAAVVERAGGLDVERDWDEVLSLGEQQTLAFVRLLLAAPRFVLLDRPGTVLQADSVGRAVDLLASRSIAVVNFTSDGERAAGYDARLDLAADGSWRWDSSRPAGGDA